MSAGNPFIATRPRLRYFWISLLALLIIVVVVVGWTVYCGITISLQAEMNLHDTEFTIQLVEQFVHDKGHWPRSWAELEQLPFPSKTPSPLAVRYRQGFRLLTQSTRLRRPSELVATGLWQRWLRLLRHMVQRAAYADDTEFATIAAPSIASR